MQTANEVGKYVTDGKKIYPYNSYLDDLLQNGKLQFCERPSTINATPKPVYRTPITYTPEERMALAQKLNVTLGELTNMSPQEFEAALVSLETNSVTPVQQPEAGGFPS